ncbi:MAG: DUF1800 domain-containing protein [Nevskiaceae bacterium]|nr:MAG: DUF1800 domain-containing protein [Nevskiaceae bacterium]TAM23889.1 MAG: DUF1800 domain-containing protein [Nevskiaceae bacterium]
MVEVGVKDESGERTMWQSVATRIMTGTAAIAAPAGAADKVLGGTLLDRGASARFLTQTTFGPTRSEIDRVALIGRDLWLLEQLGKTPTLHLPRYQALLAQSASAADARYAAWWEISLTAPDQLRQRVAFALSEIFVVSDADTTLNDRPMQVTAYYDLLVRNAFGNYRSLIEQVALSQAMGLYLSHLGNDKPDPVSGRRPDENFAREVMQLFSIGLWQLNRDGSPILDAKGEQIPTYDQEVIESYARIYTGWTWAHRTTWGRGSSVADETDAPMKAFPDHHDSGSKVLIDGSLVPAGQTPEQDLKAALDSLFNHANVPPFVARQLIIKLITSNPSPAFIDRIARVFENNGLGVRGDLGAVVTAIFLDPEARLGFLSDQTVYGKLKEPLLRLSQLLRAFEASSRSGIYGVGRTQAAYAQAPLGANSVFNFFSPQFQQPGPIKNAGYYSPEFQLQTETQGVLIVDNLGKRIALISATAGDNDPVLDLSSLVAEAADSSAMLDDLNVLMLGGSMSTSLRDIAARAIALTPDAGDEASRLKRAQIAVTVIAVSPEYAVQR